MIVGRQLGGRPVTPQLDKLIAESYYFPNMISQAGQGMTADTEFVTATGSPAAQGQAGGRHGLGPQALGHRPHALRLRLADGHHARQLREVLEPDQALSRDRLAALLRPRLLWRGAHARRMGESDAGFFSSALPIVRKYDAAKKPAYIELITLTSHHPFTQLPSSLRPLPLTPAAKGTVAGRYAQAQNYTDREVGKFLSSLEKDGILDRSVVIIYGDHFGLSDGNAKELAGRDEVVGPYTAIDRLRVPLIIHLPNQTQGVTTLSLLSQADLPATVADLVGVPLTKSRVFGGSAFLERHDPVIPTASRLALGSFVSEAGLLRPGMGLDGATFVSYGGSSAQHRRVGSRTLRASQTDPAALRHRREPPAQAQGRRACGRQGALASRGETSSRGPVAQAHTSILRVASDQTV